MTIGRANILFGIVFTFLFFPIIAFSETVVIDPTYGPANIQGDNGSYYHFKMKVKVDDKSTLTFGKDSCIILGGGNRLIEDCWIHIASWTGAMSVSQQAPIMMNTLMVNTPSQNQVSVHKWNANMIDGPEGALIINLEKGGSVDLYFLWKVPPDFSPKEITIKKLFEVIIN